jgi:hypothetical protein
MTTMPERLLPLSKSFKDAAIVERNRAAALTPPGCGLRRGRKNLSTFGVETESGVTSEARWLEI